MKKIIAIFALTLSVSLPMSAQIFMLEDEMNSRASTDAEDPFVLNSGGLEYDQTNYTPLENCLLVMTTLGGMYLLSKRKKQQ